MFAYFTRDRFPDTRLELGIANHLEFTDGSSFRPLKAYLDRYGYFQAVWNHTGSSWATVRFDPEMIDSSSGLVGHFDTTLIPFFMGDFEPITGTQRVYSHDSSTVFNERSYSDPTAVINPAPWSMIAWNQPSAASGITNTDDGWWELHTSFNSDNAVFFPEWGAGGHMILNRGQCRVDGFTQPEVMVLVNLSTGAGTILDIPAKFAASPTDFQAGPLFGEADTVNIYIQFVPDADSRHNAPKGRIFCSLRGLEPVTNEFRFYVQFYDWNPTGASGSPARVHQRLGVSTRCLIDAPATNTTVLGSTPGRVRVGDVNPTVQEHMLFDSARGRIIMFSSTLDAGGSGGIPRTGCHNIIEFFQSADLAFLRPPQSLAPPSSGRVVIFDTDTRGDLGEVIGGHVINWSIEATSTEGEVIDVSGSTPGDPFTLTNGPINLTIDYPKTVYKDGSPLTEGVHFDWNTTQVDFIAPEPVDPGFVYTVDYAHTDDPVTPAHGTLLNATSITDAEGLGQSRVRYADDDTLEFARDKVTAQADT
jgi:hypothetical protein